VTVASFTPHWNFLLVFVSSLITVRMATFFEDLGKPADDLIVKGFPAEGSFKISTEVKTDNGVTLTTTGRRFFKAGAENVEAVFEPKFAWAAQNVEFTGKFSTGSEYETGVSVKDLASKGSKLGFTGVQNQKGWSLKPSAEFKNDIIAVKATAAWPDDRVAKPLTAEASAVAAYEKSVNVGGKATYATGYTAKGAAVEPVLGYSVKAGYLQPLWQAIGSFTQAVGSQIFGATYYQKVTDATTLATSFTVDRLAAVSAPAASVAGEYKYAADTTLKSKFAVTPAKDFRLALALQQNWTTASTVTIGADLNALTLLGTNKGDAHSFGVEIKLK